MTAGSPKRLEHRSRLIRSQMCRQRSKQVTICGKPFPGIVKLTEHGRIGGYGEGHVTVS